jgi:hypothetical protein
MQNIENSSISTRGESQAQLESCHCSIFSGYTAAQV